MMGEQRFSVIPTRAVTDKSMPAPVFRTLAALGMFTDKNGWCYPSLRALSELLGVSRSRVSRHIKWLAEHGYLNVLPQYNADGSRGTNRIQVRFDYLPDDEPQETAGEGGGNEPPPEDEPENAPEAGGVFRPAQQGVSPSATGGVSPSATGGVSPSATGVSPSATGVSLSATGVAPLSATGVAPLSATGVAPLSATLTPHINDPINDPINARLQQQASTTVNRGGNPRTPAAVAAAAKGKLPEEITAGLKAIGWRGPVGDVLRYWQADPDRVENLVWYAQKAGWGGGLLRNALHSGEWPPEFKPGSAADLARWREEAARLDALTESRSIAPAAPPRAGDRKAPNGNGDGKPKVRDDEGGTQPPRPDIGALPPPTPDMRRWWAFAVGQIRVEMPKADFDAWLRPTRLIARRGDDDRLVFVVATANDYAQRWLTERLTKILERKLTGLAGRPVTVQFIVLEDAHA